ncbi:MAG: excinuclease ABC subunit UvrA, partial [Clostridiales bacterium]|nr:excinuclease ABC subunit UvrA [Clostridiales bacterium]
TMPEGTRFQVLSPIIRGKKGEHTKVFEDARKSGFARVRVDGINFDLSEEIELDKNKKHKIELVVDRLILRGDITRRLTDSIETALSHADGLAIIQQPDSGEETLFSRNYACEDCGISMPELSPRLFSFNNPLGACPTCSGLGFRLVVDPALIIPDPKLSIYDGGIQASGWGNIKNDSIARMYFEAMALKYRFDLHTPICDLPEEALQVILYGTNGEKLHLHYERGNGRGTLEQAFEGIIPNIERRVRETQSDAMRKELEEYMATSPCPKCQGERLSEIARAVTVGGLSITKFCDLSVKQEMDFLDGLKLEGANAVIADQILREIRARLGFLQSVGLQYLTLSRAAGTLSGGEAQRIRLATQIGSSLMGVLYILDEPSIGLHQRDNDKLLETLRHLRDLGNTLIVVEHDEDTMRAADYIVDVGPGAGIHGGEIVAAGTLEDILRTPESLTGQYLSGARKIPVPISRRSGNGNKLSIFGCAENNLAGIDVSVPLGTFTCVTGVSGSGKSSLVNEIIAKRLASSLNRAKVRPGKFERIEGEEHLDKVIVIDQSPIGRTPRSNPATYTGLFSDIRELFASTAAAKERGFSAGRFSFNVKGGRCEACCGDGLVKIEMHFLPDVYVPCEVCHGKRYNRETLEILYRGKTVSDVLEMTADEALEFFEHQPRLREKIAALVQVGLGYIKLGQSSTTLSGGEAQRVKLATELSRPATGRTLYILDEPTTGLHMYDVQKLLDVLQKLVDAGNTVLVIEHNLDMIKSADHLIDLGPEGGDGGGQIVAIGTPEEVADCAESFTGQYLKKVLQGG